FTGAGWLPFFPTPRPGPEPSVGAGAPPPTVAPEPSPTDRPDEPDPKTGASAPLSPTASPWWGLLALALIVASYLGAVLAAPAVRRWRRRHTGTPRTRAVGAWHDLLDELADQHGLRATLTAATPAQVRRLVTERRPDSATEAGTLAAVARDALFGE